MSGIPQLTDIEPGGVYASLPGSGVTVLEFRTVEDCAEESRTFECRIDEGMSEALIHHLGDLGTLEYFPEFTRPFFKITRRGGFLIRGVLGSGSFQVVFFDDHKKSWPLIEGQLRSHRTNGGATNGTAS